MGGELNVVCVDVDPRNKGDLSYFDLIEAHGDDAFPPTREKPTGGGGWHKLYRLSEAIKSAKGETKGKLAPGIDIKGVGGLIVGAGCAHVSGNRYGDYNDEEIADAPQWMEMALRKLVACEAPEKVIEFQADRERSARARTSGGDFFGVGERNDGLRDVALGRWTHADDWGIGTEQDLYDQVRYVRDTRCANPSDDPAPDDAWLRDLIRRTVRNYARNSSMGKVVAA
jgi:hypothetical protein